MFGLDFYENVSISYVAVWENHNSWVYLRVSDWKLDAFLVIHHCHTKKSQTKRSQKRIEAKNVLKNGCYELDILSTLFNFFLKWRILWCGLQKPAQSIPACSPFILIYKRVVALSYGDHWRYVLKILFLTRHVWHNEVLMHLNILSLRLWLTIGFPIDPLDQFIKDIFGTLWFFLGFWLCCGKKNKLLMWLFQNLCVKYHSI